MIPKRIGFIAFDGITALDMVGPMEAFAIAHISDSKGKRRPCYEVVTLGLNKKNVTAESGLVIAPSTTLQSSPALDTLIVPGGGGLRKPLQNEPIVRWIKTQSVSIRRIASVCTGIYGLAPTSLLNGRKVTTHWRFAADVAQQFPQLKVDSNALFLKDGPFYTSAGVTAGIDLSLALIEEDYGRVVALSVARELVVYLKRSGGQEQYSEPLRFQVASSDPIAELAAWIAGHLEHDLSIQKLAGKACLSERQFTRRFQAVFGATAAEYVEQIRLSEASSRLSASKSSIQSIARSVGFRSGDTFCRAFERRFGIPPSVYRSRFESSFAVKEHGGRHR
jgi:transcriptional regulator GlxA family with amidase domain